METISNILIYCMLVFCASLLMACLDIRRGKKLREKMMSQGYTYEQIQYELKRQGLN